MKMPLGGGDLADDLRIVGPLARFQVDVLAVFHAKVRERVVIDLPHRVRLAAGGRDDHDLLVGAAGQFHEPRQHLLVALAVLMASDDDQVAELLRAVLTHLE
jgi:hypothetical protein